MARLIVNGKNLLFSEIASGRFDDSGSDLEKRIFEFIKNWYSEKTEFEVRTSGSTGPPKKIRISKESMKQSAMLTAGALGLKPGMSALLAMDTKYIAGMMMISRALTIGMDLVAVKSSANPFQSLNPDTRINFAAFVPLQIDRILQEGGPGPLERINVILLGGSRISLPLAEKIENLKVPVYQTYGMTETLSHVALRGLNGSEKSEKYKVLPGFQIKKDGRGCLIVSGGFLKGEIMTNDLVDITASDRFKWIGRYDNVINSGGIKFHPEILEPIIEEVLRNKGFGIKRFFLSGIPDEKLGEQMVLFVESNPELSVQNLHEFLKTKLESYQCPKKVITLEKFELTETGKLKRTPMIEKYLSHI